MHAGIAEVAAAKARMFVNKPDGSMLFDLFGGEGGVSLVLGLVRHFFGC